MNDVEFQGMLISEGNKWRLFLTDKDEYIYGEEVVDSWDKVPEVYKSLKERYFEREKKKAERRRKCSK